METSAVGGSNARINSVALSAAGGKEPFRLPCKSHTYLMSLFGVVPGQSPYDLDLAELLHVCKGKVT